MVMREHGYVESKSDKSDQDEMTQLEDYSDVEYLIDGEALMIKRTLNV